MSHDELRGYPSENNSELKEYLNKKNKIVITGEEMKKKAISQRGSGSLVPSHLNDMAFFTDSILNPGENVKELFFDKDSSGRELSEGQQKYFKDSTVRDDNGNLKVVYRGDTNMNGYKGGKYNILVTIYLSCVG